MDNNMVNKIRVGMFTTNIHLLQFKIQSHLQKHKTLNASTSELIPKENHLKFLSLHSPFRLFLNKKNYLNCHPSFHFIHFIKG